jgi:hypothetical protein
MIRLPELSVDERRSKDLELADQSRLNVLWLLGQDRRERALEIRVGPCSLGAGLAAMYQTVEVLNAESLGRSSNDFRLPPGDNEFDLVTLYGMWPDSNLQRDLRRVLRHGGLALIAYENSCWAGRLRRAPRRQRGQYGGFSGERPLRAAGFRDVRTFWVEPSLLAQRSLVPARFRTVVAYEHLKAHQRGRAAIRAWAARVGLQGLLYPAVLVVAEA